MCIKSLLTTYYLHRLVVFAVYHRLIVDKVYIPAFIWVEHLAVWVWIRGGFSPLFLPSGPCR